MKGDGPMHSRLSTYVSLWLLFLIVLAATPAALQAGEARAQRLVFASAGFHDSNRFWTVARPDHLQYDPFLETLARCRPEEWGLCPPPGREVAGKS